MMKFISGLTLTLLLLAGGPAARAQVLHSRPNFGVKIGLTSGYSDYSPREGRIQKFNSAPHVAVFYRMRGVKWAIQPELGYSQRGGSHRTDSVRTVRDNFRFLTASLALGYIVTEGLTLEAGPEYLFAPKSFSPGPEVRSGYGFMVGLRYDFMDLADRFSFGLRYHRALNNFSTVAGQHLNVSGVQFSLMFNFYQEK